MPTNNPRVNVTLAPAMSARIKRISELTGQSQSALISTLLDAQADTFDRLIRVLDAAEKAKAHADTILAGGAEQIKEAQARIESQLGLALDEFDTITDNLLKDAERVQRRGRAGEKSAGTAPSGRAVAARLTPPSNRGVRSTVKTPKKSTPRRG
jgi:hypothetical protein